MSKRWTEEEDLFLREEYPSNGVKYCASILERSEASITARAFILGVRSLQGFGNKHTHEWYEAELFRKEIDHFPLEKYKGYDTPIDHECLNSHVTRRSPNNVLRGSECSVCIGNTKRSPDQYQEELVSKGIIYLPLEVYIDTDTNILHECPVCSNRWKARPSHILSGHGCPKCKRPGGYSFTMFDNNPDKASMPGICYLVVLIDKESQQKIAYKIGITKGTSNKDVLKRMQGIKEYETRILKIHRGTLLEVFTLEQRLHAKWGKYKVLPDKKFGGWQECFELNDMIVKTFPFV